jgi:lipid kinase, YegS/Rv2252/BmrU family
MAEVWKAIVSSKSGGGKAAKAWTSIASMLQSKGIQFSEAFTDHRFHALELASEAVLAGFRKIIAIGGDGAIHEILNGIMSQDVVPSNEVTLAIIPVGSGNDWARLHNIPFNHEKAVEAIAADREVIQDIAKVDSVMDGKPYSRYMINIGGLGIDAQVCHDFEIAKSSSDKGDASYLKCLVNGFINFKNPVCKVVADGELFYEGEAMSVALGIGKYCGGGMMQTPGAVFDDGLIDVTVVPGISKLKFARNLPRLYKGTVYEAKEISHTRAKTLEISAEPASFVEVDGESVGTSPITVSVIPAAIKVITNI